MSRATNGAGDCGEAGKIWLMATGPGDRDMVGISGGDFGEAAEDRRATR